MGKEMKNKILKVLVSKSYKKRLTALLLVSGILLFLVNCSSAIETVTDTSNFHNPRTTVPSGTSYEDTETHEFDESSSLNSYYLYAQRNNRRIQAAYSQWQAAVEVPLQRYILPNPQVSFQADDSFKSRELMLQQSFPWFGKRGLQKDAAQSSAWAKFGRYREIKFDVFQELRSAFAEYYYLAQGIETTKETLLLVEYFKDVVRRKYETGSAEHADVIRVEVETEKLRDKLSHLEEARLPQRARINKLLGRSPSLPLPEPIHLVKEEERKELPEEKLKEFAVTNNPSLLAHCHLVDRQQASLELARKEYYPDFTLGLMRMEEGMGGMGESLHAMMVSIDIPIWRAAYDAGVREAEKEYEAKYYFLGDAKYEIEMEMERALFSFRDASRRVGLYEDHLLPKARESLGTMETAYRAGKVEIIDWLDAQRELLNFELEKNHARSEYFKAIGEIEKLIGKHIEEIKE